eukprot:3562435-Pleurochrysis_carterae.AAC.2
MSEDTCPRVHVRGYMFEGTCPMQECASRSTHSARVLTINGKCAIDPGWLPLFRQRSNPIVRA